MGRHRQKQIRQLVCQAFFRTVFQAQHQLTGNTGMRPEDVSVQARLQFLTLPGHDYSVGAQPDFTVRAQDTAF